MQLKRIGPWLLIIIIIAIAFGLKARQKQSTSSALETTQIKGPAVILFRGDNSSSCRIIRRLIDEAAARHGKQINFAKLDWSADNPLIQQYQIRFLPTVIFVDRHDKEVDRIVGESPEVQQQLAQALDLLEVLLLQ